MLQLPEGTTRVEGTKMVGSATDPSMLVEIEMACFGAGNNLLEVVSKTWDLDDSPMPVEEARVAVARMNDVLAVKAARERRAGG